MASSKKKSKPAKKAKPATKSKVKAKKAKPAKVKAKAKSSSKPKKSVATPVKSAQRVTVPSHRTSKPARQSETIGFSPLFDNVLIRQDGESDRTPGGLYIPAMAQDKPAKGKVLATGQGAFNKKGHLRPLDVKRGETVLFGRYSGAKITLDGEDLLILKESDILGVVRN